MKMAFSRVASSLLFLLFLSFTSQGAAATFTVEQVLSSPFPSNLVAASRAGRMAWVFNAKGSRNLWIADVPSFAARPVTHYSGDDGQPIASLRITPDGRTLVYVRGSETNESGRVADPTSSVSSRKQQVWAMEVDGDSPRLLGEMGCGEEECEDVELSPDGQFAVWATRKQLWIAPVSGATSSHQLTDLRGENSAPKWSPDGRQIAFVRTPGVQDKLPLIPVRVTPWAIWMADAATGNGKEIWHSGNQPNDSFPRLTANSSFYFVTDDKLIFASEQDGWNHLYSISPTGGSATLLTSGVFEVEDVAPSFDGRSVLISSNQGDVDRRHIWRVGLETGKAQALTTGESIEWNPVETSQGNFVVCFASNATVPAMLYRVTAQGKEMIAAAALPADFTSKQLVVPKAVVFKSEDGLDIRGQLFTHLGRSQPGPALIFMHGGPMRQMLLGFHYMYYYHNAYAMNQYLASQGYVVLSVNYRLGIMYGRAFREADNASWRGAAEYKDILAGAGFLQSQATVDPKKIGLWGGSYGGYLTALGLARNSNLFASGVDLHGVHDWSVFLPRWENRPGAPDSKEAEKLAFESSPNASVATWRSPVLLIHGDDDRNVPFDQTVDLAQRLRENHVQFEELIFPDDIHDFLMWKNWVRAYTGTADFFARTLK